MPEAERAPVYRVLDANLNRLREALRVIEEYFRFINEQPVIAGKLKALRHRLIAIEATLGQQELLANRDSETDCFARENRPEELERNGLEALLAANFRRGQEACRVIEEYAKMIAGSGPDLSENAKTIRFDLYTLEKEVLGGEREGIPRR